MRNAMLMAAFVGALVPHHARADSLQNQLDAMQVEQEIQHNQVMDAIGGQHYGYAGPMPKRKFWYDMTGSSHDCAYDRSIFVEIFGTCR